MTGNLPTPPYPSDIRARGWRFELDYERIEQSSTWILSAAEARPWLLMMWMMAWKQTPCGSLPAEEEVIAAMIGMPFDLWPKYRKVLMRGWTAANDGRMYHKVLTERVNEMMRARRKEADRKALSRAKSKAAESADPPPAVPDLSHGTAAGLAQDSTGLPPESATGTGTGTCNTDNYGHALLNPARALDDSPPPLRASPEASVCVAMRTQGMGDVNPGHPDVKALLAGGADLSMFLHAARTAVERKKGFAYALGIVRSQLADATRLAKAAAN